MKNKTPTAKNNIDIGSNTIALVFNNSETKGSAATEKDALWTAHEKKYAPDAQNPINKIHLAICRNIVVRRVKAPALKGRSSYGSNA
jgi:hypothetical protein